MRISTTQVFQRAVLAMQDKQAELSDTERRLATGDRILSPHEDPSGAARILDLDEQKSRIEQYQRNSDAAQSRLDQEETALTAVMNILQRVRELAVRGNTDSMSVTDRQAVGDEVMQNMQSILQLANTTDANGEYLFAGTRTDTVPFSHNGVGTFTYNGDQGQRLLQVGATREVAIGDSGDFVFNNLPANAGGTINVMQIVYDFAANMQAGNKDPNVLADLDTAMIRIDTVRSEVGARGNAIDNQATANESFKLAIEENRSTLADLDYAEAVSKFQQQLTALQASQQSFINIQDLSLFNFIS